MKTKSVIIYILSALCIISTLCMIIVLSFPKKETAKFVPPNFDENAISGKPIVSEELGWNVIYQDGMEYKSAICGNIIINDNTADVYFWNDSENSAWLKLRVYDLNGKIVAETGIIKPNNYIEEIAFTEPIANGDKLKLKIMAYEPETYYSKGSVVLNTTVRIED